MTTIVTGLADLVSSYGVSTLVKATVILMVSLAVVRIARRGRASVRHLVLVAGFAGLLALPIAVALAPPVAVDLAPMPIFMEDDIGLSVLPESAISASGTPVVDTPSASIPWNLTAWEVIAVLWVIGVVVFVTPVLLGLVQVRRLRRTGLPWRAGQRLVDALASDAGVRRRVDVLRHEAIAAPATSGIGRHTILFPIDVDAWADADVICAAVHEIEHVRRADCIVNAVTRVICAIYWFHPLVWIAWRRLGLEAERACDDAVLGRAEAAAYADQLVTLAGRLSGNARHPLLAMANRSDLVRRVAAVLDQRQARGHAGVAAAGAIAIAATVLIATLSPLQAVHSAAGLAIGQDTDGDVPRFEVATIRVNRSGDRRASHSIVPASGRLTITNVTVRDLIQEAYGVPLLSQLVNVPEWATRTRVDVVAKAASSAPASTLQRMLQPLLAEHFKLVVRRETRDMEVYAMVAANPGQLGPQLRRNDAACDDRVGTAGGFARAPEGAPNEKGTCGILPGGAGRIVARGLDMAGLAAFIGTVPGRMVIDRTGLTGRFDVDLTYTPSFAAAAALAQRPGAAPPPGVDPSGPPLITALREQLGLRLDPMRAPVEVLVIERAEPLSVDAPAAVPAAQAPPRRPRFDVAAIRRCEDVSGRGGGPSRITPESALWNCQTLEGLIQVAYVMSSNGRVLDTPISGPAWVREERYTITAKAEGVTDPALIQGPMLQALLEDRFKLKLRRESRDVPVTLLAVARGGHRLKPFVEGSCTPRPPNFRPGDPPWLRDGETPCRSFGTRKGRNVVIEGQGITLDTFAEMLRGQFGRVINKTGIEGRFDINVMWDAPNGPLGAVAALTNEPSAPSVFAVLDELGLKIEEGRDRGESLVIEAVERPSEN